MTTTLRYLIFIAVMVFGYQTAALGTPKADCPALHYDAGQIEQGAMILCDFTFQNTGDEPLTIKVNDCGCGGLKFKPPSQPIKPGQKGSVTVSIPTINRKGAYKREIMIGTNDPAQKEIRLSVAAQILETVSIVPQYIDFGLIKQGSISKKNILITNTGRKPFTIVNIESEPAGIATITPTLKQVTLKPGDKRSIEVSLGPPSRPGLIEGVVNIKTDRKDIAEKIIFIRAETGKD